MSDLDTERKAAESPSRDADLQRELQELADLSADSLARLQEWRARPPPLAEKELGATAAAAPPPSEGLDRRDVEAGLASDAAQRLLAARIVVAPSLPPATEAALPASVSVETLRQDAIGLLAKQLAAARLAELGISEGEGDDGKVSTP